MSITDPSQRDKPQESEASTMILLREEPTQEKLTQEEPTRGEDSETTMGGNQSSPQLNLSTTTVKAKSTEAESRDQAEAAEPQQPTPTEEIEAQVISEAAQASIPVVQKKKVCGVCNKGEGRYNCVRCSLPFCSVSCNNTHKATHPLIPPAFNLPPKPPPVQPSNGSARPGTVAATGSINPFAALDDCKELQALFKLYPSLPKLLTEIHAATLRPLEDDSQNQYKNGNKRGYANGRSKKEEWNSDKGMQNGVDALHRMRDTENTDGEAVREYCQLILHLLEKDEDRKAAEVIQKELLQESVQVIQGLLQSGR